MVPVYEFDDTEYRPCYRAGRVVGHCDGSRDTGVEGIEGSPSEKGWRCHADRVAGCIVLLLLCRRRRGLEDQDPRGGELYRLVGTRISDTKTLVTDIEMGENLFINFHPANQLYKR